VLFTSSEVLPFIMTAILFNTTHSKRSKVKLNYSRIENVTALLRKTDCVTWEYTVLKSRAELLKCVRAKPVNGGEIKT
jgi:hypothetical protein